MRLARTARALAATGAIAAIVTVVATVAAAVSAMVLTGPALSAAPAAARSSISLSPPRGTPGSGFVITFSGFDSSARCTIVFFWDGQRLAAHQAATSGSVAAAVPGAAAPGPHLVSASNGCRSSASAAFWVLAGPTVTKPPPVTTTPPQPTSTVPTSPSTTTISTTTSTTTATNTEPATTAPPTSTISSGPPRLIFDRPSIQAGEPLTASGTGCDPGVAVTLTSAGERVGGTIADADGRFSTPVEFANVEPGRHEVTATCGAVLTGSIDIVLTSSTSGNTGTLVVLVIVALAAVALLVRTRGAALHQPGGGGQ